MASLLHRGRRIENQPSLFASLWRYKFLIAGAALLAAMVGYGLSSLQTPLYQSSGTILLSDPRSTGDLASELSVFFDPGRYVRNQSAVIESPVVAERASDILGGTPSADDIVGAISAEPEQDLDAITITAMGTDPIETTSVVTAVVEGYGDLISEGVQTVAKESVQQLEIAKTSLTERIGELDELVAENPDDSALSAEQRAAVDQLYDVDSQIKSIGTSALLYGSGIQLYVQPDGPGGKMSPRPLRNAAIAFVLGALAAGAFAWWKAEQDQRADTKDKPADILDAPLLAVIPEFESVKAWAPAPTITHMDSTAAEAFHFALSSLSFVLDQIGGTSVVISSADPADGKTIVALNLAVVAMRDGRSPLLIDADERRQGLTFLAGLDDDDAIGVAIGQGHRWAITPTEEIDFIASGRGLDGDIGGYFRTAEFRKELQSAMAGRELVIIDTPPVMLASETADLAAEVDGVVLVVREGSPLRDLEDARARIELSGTLIIGYIFNRASATDTSYRYSYSHK
jgi:capsular polysaccharide biosynthesis protein